MERIKCATFDKEMQNSIPKEIRDKMKADRDNAEKEQESKAKASKIIAEITKKGDLDLTGSEATFSLFRENHGNKKRLGIRVLKNEKYNEIVFLLECLVIIH